MKKMVERLRRRALKENRLDDANDKVIQHRLEVYEHETRPVLDYYPADKIVKIDATMSQIRVLHEIIKILVPLKEEMDHAREQIQASPAPLSQSTPTPVAAK
jgi:adenylate kinase